MALTRGLLVLGGIGIGAGIMYLLDPDRGRTRRAHLKDQAVGRASDAGHAIGSKARDIRNRAQGVVAESKSLLGKGQQQKGADTIQ